MKRKQSGSKNRERKLDGFFIVIANPSGVEGEAIFIIKIASSKTPRNDSTMDNDEMYQKLLGFGLNFVSIRPRSEKEIREYVLKKIHRWKIPSAFFENVLDRLRELGYVDDLKFALAFIGSRNRSRPKGTMLLRMELQKKGVDQDCIESALKLLKTEGVGNESDLARTAAQKKLRSLQRYDRMIRRRKLYSFLMRRGFDHNTISSVIDELSPKGLQ